MVKRIWTFYQLSIELAKELIKSDKEYDELADHYEDLKKICQRLKAENDMYKREITDLKSEVNILEDENDQLRQLEEIDKKSIFDLGEELSRRNPGWQRSADIS